MSTEVLRSINLDNMNIYERRLHAFHIISVLFAHTVCSLKALKGREVGREDRAVDDYPCYRDTWETTWPHLKTCTKHLIHD